MTTLNIDIGTTACMGGCEHCRLGAQKPPEVTHFSNDTLRVVEQLLLYAMAEGQETRVAYTSPLLGLQKVPFLDMTNSLSVSIGSVMELSDQRILTQLKGFTGEELQLNLNHTVFAPETTLELFDSVLALFNEVSTQLPQVKHLIVGINHNTVTQEPVVLMFDSVVAGHAFIRYVESHLNRRCGFGLSEIKQENFRSTTKLRATVGAGKQHLTLLIRYMQKPDVSKVNVVSPFTFDMDELSVLVVDRGVHVAHFAYAINLPELWFTHAEFEGLVAQAIHNNMSLLAVCKAVVKHRRE